ncbi:MAG TPA: response regulator [Thermodesulfovibrionales bacterium]|nr:response regulator [Thermodesulfovibrionales bacterium]
MASILIVDDSSFMRGKLRAILKKENHTIQEADDGIRGLQLASSQPFDVILLDIIMPGMDGLKILGALHERHSTSPVIIITADIQESVHRQCLELGAVEVLHKPPRESDLLNAIARVTQRTGAGQS